MTHLLHQPQTGGEFSPTTNKTINGLQLDFNPTGVYWGIVHLQLIDHMEPMGASPLAKLLWSPGFFRHTRRVEKKSG